MDSDHARPRGQLPDVGGGAPVENAAALRAILAGEESPRADVVALNAALALLVAERVASLGEGLELARQSLGSGAARSVFDALRVEGSAEMEFA